MKNKIMFILILLPIFVVSQNRTYLYKGHIGDLPITMKLTSKSDPSKNCITEYFGTYIYDNVGTPIRLSGALDPCAQGMVDNTDPKVILSEYVGENNTGYFSLKNIGSKKCYGTWSNNKKTYNVILIKQ